MTKEEIHKIIVDCDSDRNAKKAVLDWLGITTPNIPGDGCIRLSFNELKSNPRGWYEAEMANSGNVKEIISYKEFCNRLDSGKLAINLTKEELVSEANRRYKPGMVIRCPYGNGAPDQVIESPLDVTTWDGYVYVKTRPYGPTFSVYNSKTGKWAQILSMEVSTPPVKDPVERLTSMLGEVGKKYPVNSYFIDIWGSAIAFKVTGYPYVVGRRIVVQAMNTKNGNLSEKILYSEDGKWATPTEDPNMKPQIDMRSLLSKALTDYLPGTEYYPVGSIRLRTLAGSIQIAGDDIIVVGGGCYVLYDGSKKEWATKRVVSDYSKKISLKEELLEQAKRKYQPGMTIASAANSNLKSVISDPPDHRWEGDDWITVSTRGGRYSVLYLGVWAELEGPPKETPKPKWYQEEAQPREYSDNLTVRLPTAIVLPSVNKDKKRRILI